MNLTTIRSGSPLRWILGAALAAAATLAAAPPTATPGAVFDSLAVQRARTKTVTSRGHQVFYTRHWNLDDLPDYVPGPPVSGAIRFWGSNYFTDGRLGEYWREGFQKYQPGVKLDYNLKTAAAAIPGLLAGVADIGIDHKITWKNLLAFQRIYGYSPLEIVAVTGSFNVPGWSNALVMVVNKDNPIDRLTLDQLDGIFGAQRSGGWVGTEWHPEFARGPEKNLRTWGQLGLTGAWADRPIQVYGLNLEYQQATDISRWILRGSDKWNEQLRMYANYAHPDGTLAIGAKLLIADIGRDPSGIGYGSFSYLTPQVKALALADRRGGPYVAPSLETVRDRSYPLFDEIYFYLNRPPGQPLDPKLREFLRYVLSRQGQEAVERDGKYLPLPAAVVREQLKKLD